MTLIEHCEETMVVLMQKITVRKSLKRMMNAHCTYQHLQCSNDSIFIDLEDESDNDDLW